jgi:hypothetical protein
MFSFFSFFSRKRILKLQESEQCECSLDSHQTALKMDTYLAVPRRRAGMVAAKKAFDAAKEAHRICHANAVEENSRKRFFTRDDEDWAIWEQTKAAYRAACSTKAAWMAACAAYKEAVAACIPRRLHPRVPYGLECSDPSPLKELGAGAVGVTMEMLDALRPFTK